MARLCRRFGGGRFPAGDGTRLRPARFSRYRVGRRFPLSRRLPEALTALGGGRRRRFLQVHEHRRIAYSRGSFQNRGSGQSPFPIDRLSYAPCGEARCPSALRRRGAGGRRLPPDSCRPCSLRPGAWQNSPIGCERFLRPARPGCGKGAPLRRRRRLALPQGRTRMFPLRCLRSGGCFHPLPGGALPRMVAADRIRHRFSQFAEHTFRFRLLLRPLHQPCQAFLRGCAPCGGIRRFPPLQGFLPAAAHDVRQEDAACRDRSSCLFPIAGITGIEFPLRRRPAAGCGNGHCLAGQGQLPLQGLLPGHRACAGNAGDRVRQGRRGTQQLRLFRAAPLSILPRFPDPFPQELNGLRLRSRLPPFGQGDVRGHAPPCALDHQAPGLRISGAYLLFPQDHPFQDPLGRRALFALFLLRLQQPVHDQVHIQIEVDLRGRLRRLRLRFLQIGKLHRAVIPHRLAVAPDQLFREKLRQKPKGRQGPLSLDPHIRFCHGNGFHQKHPL